MNCPRHVVPCKHWFMVCGGASQNHVLVVRLAPMWHVIRLREHTVHTYVAYQPIGVRDYTTGFLANALSALAVSSTKTQTGS